jgi:hypothetical protein
MLAVRSKMSFLRLPDLVCPDGGPIDEGVALDAWLETVAGLEAMGVSDPATLSPAQMREVFIEFIVHSIEARIFPGRGSQGPRPSLQIWPGSTGSTVNFAITSGEPSATSSHRMLSPQAG